MDQIHRLEAAGCEIVRVAVPDMAAAKALGAIRSRIHIPLVADIHFDYRLALESIDQGADKIRLNPGNIGGEDRVKAVADACRARHVPIRIGVNGGSLEKELRQKYGGVTAQALVDSAMGHVALLNKFDFDDICISVKCSSVPLTMAAYRLLSERCNYPLHLGVTEAGTPSMGLVKSAMGIGGLLCLGIGDTLRVTLTADPVEEVYAAKKILQAAGLRQEGPNIIACPTCGRTNIDLIPWRRRWSAVWRTAKNPSPWRSWAVPSTAPGRPPPPTWASPGEKGRGFSSARGRSCEKSPRSS